MVLFTIMITPIIVGLLGAVAVTLSIILVRFNVLLTRFRFSSEKENIAELPSVSVCIPARNETHAMTECLERVLASDYEKLEIIAEDSDKNDRLNAFDLLIDKAKDILQVERREKSRTIISLDMFAKMNDSWQKHKIL